MANIQFETISVSNTVKGFVKGTLSHFKSTGKTSVRAIIEGPDEDGVVQTRTVFLGWKDGNARPEIGCLVQETKWKNLDDGREGTAFSPIVLSQDLDEEPVER